MNKLTEIEQPRKMDRIDTWVLTIKEIVSAPPGNTDDRLDLRSALVMFQEEVFGDLEEACKKYHEVMSHAERDQASESIKKMLREKIDKLDTHFFQEAGQTAYPETDPQYVLLSDLDNFIKEL